MSGVMAEVALSVVHRPWKTPRISKQPIQGRSGKCRMLEELKDLKCPWLKWPGASMLTVQVQAKAGTHPGNSPHARNHQFSLMPNSNRGQCWKRKGWAKSARSPQSQCQPLHDQMCSQTYSCSDILKWKRGIHLESILGTDWVANLSTGK